MGGLFLEEFFGKNYLFYFDVEEIDLFVNLLSKSKKERRRKNLNPQKCDCNCTSHLKNNLSTQHAMSLLFSCTYRTGKSKINLFSYCGLVNARISASEKDFPKLHQQSRKHRR